MKAERGEAAQPGEEKALGDLLAPSVPKGATRDQEWDFL